MSKVPGPRPMLRASALLLAQLVLLVEVGPSPAAPTAPSARDAGSRTLVVSAGDRLTVSAAQARLQEVLDEIARQTEIRISSHTEFVERVSMAFADLPIEDGLRRLVADHHFMFVYGPSGGLEEVRAYRSLPAGLRPETPPSAAESPPRADSPRETVARSRGQGSEDRAAVTQEVRESPPGQGAEPVDPAKPQANPQGQIQDDPPQRPGRESPGRMDPRASPVGVTVSGTIANPTITGPIPATGPAGSPSHNYPQLASQFDLAPDDYVEEEYFVEGTANRYRTAPLTTGAIVSTGTPYRTRMIVRRPRSPATFNGTVLVEWLDVTSGFDVDAMWMASHRHVLREGYAYVGVSAQRRGLHEAKTGLRAWSPVRYSTLDVTAGGAILDDSLSYDIFSQAAQAIRHPVGVDPLRGLPVQRIFAIGARQPPEHLVTYHNSIHPLAVGFDAFLFLGIGGQLRTDLDVKVFVVDTETDILDKSAARPADSNRLRTWEVAGGSRVEFDRFELGRELSTRDDLPTPNLADCSPPAPSRIPTAYVLNAAYDHLVRWVADATPPPTAPRIELASPSPVVVARDRFGNVRGGIQLAQHAVPTATNTGKNSGPAPCTLYGSHEPFDAARLAEIYPSHEAYVSAVSQVTDKNLADGYIVAPDAEETKERAAQSDIRTLTQ